jgi:hypothetical protein
MQVVYTADTSLPSLIWFALHFSHWLPAHMVITDVVIADVVSLVWSLLS